MLKDFFEKSINESGTMSIANISPIITNNGLEMDDITARTNVDKLVSEPEINTADSNGNTVNTITIDPNNDSITDIDQEAAMIDKINQENDILKIFDPIMPNDNNTDEKITNEDAYPNSFEVQSGSNMNAVLDSNNNKITISSQAQPYNVGSILSNNQDDSKGSLDAPITIDSNDYPMLSSIKEDVDGVITLNPEVGEVGSTIDTTGVNNPPIAVDGADPNTVTIGVPDSYINDPEDTININTDSIHENSTIYVIK